MTNLSCARIIHIVNKYEVPLEYGKVPVVHTSDELLGAAASLITSHHACVLDLDAEAVSAYRPPTQVGFDAGISLRALLGALSKANPSLAWKSDGPIPLGTHNGGDKGLHGDILGLLLVAIGFHATPPGDSVFDATFALPRAEYAAPQGSQDPYLTGLLRKDLTDSRQADPDSFRRIRITGGGIIAHTLIYPMTSMQLHEFHTLSPARSSQTWILKGR